MWTQLCNLESVCDRGLNSVDVKWCSVCGMREKYSAEDHQLMVQYFTAHFSFKDFSSSCCLFFNSSNAFICFSLIQILLSSSQNLNTGFLRINVRHFPCSEPLKTIFSTTTTLPSFHYYHSKCERFHILIQWWSGRNRNTS